MCAYVTQLYIPLSALALDVREHPGYRVLSTQLAKTDADDVWPGGLSGHSIILTSPRPLRACTSTSDAVPLHPP